MQFYQTRSNAIFLSNTVPALCTEKVVFSKSGEELYNKVYQSPRLPQKAVLKPNFYPERQDPSNFETSKESEEYGETRSDSNSDRRTKEFGETRSGNIDFRIHGLPHSTVQKQDDIRRETVKKLIHQFETHPNRESLKADLEKSQTFYPVSEKSKDFIRSIGNTEHFEMCEITAKVRCQDCLLFWEIGIVICTCGTCLRR